MKTKMPLPTVTLKSPIGFINDKRRDGWKLLENTPVDGNPELELVEFLKGDEWFVGGYMILEKTLKFGNRAGQQHAERLLSQQDSIPKEWREYHLVFPGTKWSNFNGDTCVPCLSWNRVEWFLDWIWLGSKWGFSGCFVRCK